VDPRAVVVAVERALRSVDPTAAIENAKTLEQIRDESLASRTFAMHLLTGSSVVGSVLTLVEITACFRCQLPRDAVSWQFALRWARNKSTYAS
jgi:hypothetical protein